MKIPKVIIVLLVGMFVLFSTSLVLNEYKLKSEYTSFCDERPSFCYCNFFSCEFKTSWSSSGGLSQDTKALCDLAKELKDKKMIYRIGCPS